MHRLLLDDRRLEGEHPVWREIGTYLQAVMVGKADLDDAIVAVETLMQLWGGGAAPLIPIAARDSEPDELWTGLLNSGGIDEVVARKHHDTSDLRASLCGLPLTEGIAADSLYVVLSSQVAQGKEIAIELALPDRDDPWFVSYLAALGSLPECPDEQLLYRAGLARDLDFEDLLDFEREFIDEPGGQDLVGRLQTVRNPRDLSLYGMGYKTAPWSQDLQTSPTWTMEGWTARFCGSNIVVVYEPGSVEDLCLLWTLRAAHGFPRGFPLGVPRTADVLAELRDWVDPDEPNLHFAARLRGFGRPFALTSLTVAADDLDAIAAAAPGMWQVFDATELLQPPGRPAIRSDALATFRDGEALIAGWDSETRELLRGRSPGAFGLSLHVRISLQDRPLPPLAPLRLGDRALAPAWREGGYDTQLPRQPGETVRVEWPSGLAVLRAAAAAHGLHIRPSRPGRAAEAFARRLGGFMWLDPLKDEWILHAVDRLTERRGMRWFRDRMRKITAEFADSAAEDQLERIERQLDDLRIAAGDAEDAHDLTSGNLSQRLGRHSARAWLEWAEDQGLVVRGAQIECDNCKARSWRSAGELGPPIICPGCGEHIPRPFRADHLPFRYRPSRALLEVMSEDALPHLLAASWWAALMGPGLYGIHPGIEFLDGSQVIGEADVVLLLPNGRLALGEVKRQAAGLTQHDIAQLEGLADRVDAAWTFYATPQYAFECPAIWQQLRRELPDRRAFALTAEQLLELSLRVYSPLGVDVTAWNPMSHQEREERADFFRARLNDVVDRLQSPSRLDRYIGTLEDGV
jgi:hypothetical protein